MVKKVVIIGPESTGKSTLCEMLARHFNTIWCPEFAREYLLNNGNKYDFDDLLTIAKGQLALEDEYERLVKPTSILPQGGGTLRRNFRFPSPDSQPPSLVSQLPGFPSTQLPVSQLPDFPSSQLSDSQPPSPVSQLSDFRTSGLSDSPTPQLLFIDTDQYVMKVWSEYVFGDCHNWILRRIAERPYDLYLLCKPDLPWVKDELREYPDEKPRQELYHIYRDILLNQPVSWAEISGSYNQRFELARNAVMTVI